MAAFRCGANAQAAEMAQLDLEYAVALEDHRAAADALCMLARVALRDGDLAAVTARAKEAWSIAEDLHDQRLERMPIHLLAVAARMAGRLTESRELYLHSIALNEALGEARMAAAEHRNLAYVELHAGDIERARGLVAEARARNVNLDYPALDAYLLLDDAVLAAADGAYAASAQLLGRATESWRDLGVVLDPDDAAELATLRHTLTARLGKEALGKVADLAE